MEDEGESKAAQIEILEGRQLFSITLLPSGIDEYIPPQIADIIKRYTPLGSLLGAYSGIASIASGGASSAATISVLKQTAAGLIKGRLSLPDSSLNGLPFTGKIDQNGILKALVNRKGVAGSIIGKFVGGKFNGKFNVADAVQKLKGVLKLARPTN